MSIVTTFLDDEKTQCRTAWQNGKAVIRWTRADIEKMHKESPCTVWAWGTIPHWKKSSNADVTGLPQAGEGRS